MQRSQNAFTLIELMIVIVIMAVIAAFGIPNFNRSQERVAEKDGAYNLGIISSAMEMFRVRNNGNYALGGILDNVGEINTTLDLGIIEQRIVYSCTGAGAAFTCTANPNDYAWNLNVREVDDGNPRCSAGVCPRCVGGGCPATF